MKALVTGATGFVGRHVVRELLAGGHQVVATSRDPEKAKNAPWLADVQYIAHDLNQSIESAFAYFGSPDLLLHLAWEGLPNYRELYHFEKVLWKQYAFLKSMVEHGLENCLVAGTCLEYGMQSGVLAESLDARPTTAYALAKDALRRFLEQLRLNSPFNLWWVRLFYMHGEGQSPASIIPQLERAVASGAGSFPMSGGEQLRDYLPVDQVARYLVGIATQHRTQGIINCCSGVPISIRKLVENHLKVRGLEIELDLGRYPYPDYEPMAFWGDTRKLNSALGDSR